jgi:hypothetical protein
VLLYRPCVEVSFVGPGKLSFRPRGRFQVCSRYTPIARPVTLEKTQTQRAPIIISQSSLPARTRPASPARRPSFSRPHADTSPPVT